MADDRIVSRSSEEINNYILELTTDQRKALGSSAAVIRGKINALNWVLGNEK